MEGSETGCGESRDGTGCCESGSESESEEG
jgi:hypothetical protein